MTALSLRAIYRPSQPASQPVCVCVCARARLGTQIPELRLPLLRLYPQTRHVRDITHTHTHTHTHTDTQSPQAVTQSSAGLTHTQMHAKDRPSKNQASLACLRTERSDSEFSSAKPASHNRLYIYIRASHTVMITSELFSKTWLPIGKLSRKTGRH